MEESKKGNIEIILKYIATNKIDNRIKIFGNFFVKKNKNNCKMIIDSEEYGLCSYLDKRKINTKNNIFEIKLKIIKPLTTMEKMFSNCDSLISFSSRNLDTSKVKSTSNMFKGCKKLFELKGISNWITSEIKDMSSMFKGCELLFYLPDISIWDTSKVTDMNSMFSECSSLLALPDISKWNMTNVSDISCMFMRCYCLLNFPDISKWNTSNFNFMSDLFNGCYSLYYLSDISGWDTSNLAFNSDIFRECLSLPKKNIGMN